VTLLKKRLPLGDASLLLEENAVPSILTGVNLLVAPLDGHQDIETQDSHRKSQCLSPGRRKRNLSGVNLLEKNDLGLLLTGTRKRGTGGASHLVEVGKGSSGSRSHQLDELVERLEELVRIRSRELADLIDIVKKPHSTRTGDQVGLQVFRRPGVVFPEIKIGVGVGILPRKSPPLGEGGEVGRRHLSRNQLVDGVLGAIPLLVLRVTVRASSPEVEDGDLAVRIFGKTVLIRRLVHEGLEVVESLTPRVLRHHLDDVLGVVHVHSDSLGLLVVADLPPLNGELLLTRILLVVEDSGSQRRVVKDIHSAVFGLPHKKVSVPVQASPQVDFRSFNIKLVSMPNF